MKHKIYVKDKDVVRQCLDDKNLMDTLSIYSGTAPKACHNGACGVCRIKVFKGEYEKLKMNKKHISEEDEKNNVVLACRIIPKSDMEIEFLPKKSMKDKPKVYVFGS